MSMTDTDTQQRDQLLELARDTRFCMLTTIDAGGTFFSRPMTSQQIDDDGVVWFIAARDSRKVEQIGANPHASVTMTGDGSWVSLSGQASVVDDLDQLRELWSTMAEAWLPGGPEDPNAVLVRVDVEGAEYWSSPDSRVATVISLVKSKLTGETTDLGTHAVVEDV